MKKRKLYTIVAVILALAVLTTVTVYAKVIRSSWVEKKIEDGFTETDAYSILAIVKLSDENVTALIEKKYKEFGDWDKVAEYYGVNLDDFHATVDSQIRIAQATEIPDDIYNEMVAEGMTDEECKDFARRTVNAQMDIETTWAGHKEGKTINDLIKERTDLKTAQAQAATDLAFGKISTTEYTEIMEKLAPDMTISEILAYADKEINGWMEMRKATSGITDAEIIIAQKAGFKGSAGFLDACRMKDAEKVSNLTFSEMVTQVKNGASVDEVITSNISQTKIEAAQKASGATAETE